MSDNTNDEAGATRWREIPIIPPSVMADTDLSLLAFRVFSELSLYANARNDAWPGVRELSDATGKHRKTVEAALSELEDRGYISLVRRRRRKSAIWHLDALDAISQATKAAIDDGLRDSGEESVSIRYTKDGASALHQEAKNEMDDLMVHEHTIRTQQPAYLSPVVGIGGR